MTTVYWHPFNKIFDLMLDEPTPALPSIIKNRYTANVTHFTKCPAFKDYYKNTYIVTSPMDIEIAYDPVTTMLRISPQAQDFFNAVIIHRGAQVGIKDNFLMSLGVTLTLIADKECMVEQIPATLHASNFTKRINLIGGTFDIGKWFRPLEFAFEVVDFSTPLKIKRGDPLFYIRLLPKDGSKVKLVYKEFPTETVDVINACLTVKDSKCRLPLTTYYKMAERLYHKLWFKKKKCPFNWRKNEL